MLYYSTHDPRHMVTLREAVLQGVSPDGGLYMPQTIRPLPRAFFENMGGMSLQDMSYAVINHLAQGDIPSQVLHQVVNAAFDFDIPLVHTCDNRFVLELFHGPTMACKDLGARFMGMMIGHYKALNTDSPTINVLVPTSGDTGSAVANGFLGIPKVRVFVLYPKGQINLIQLVQFATLGQNVTALEVNGTFDDCKSLIAQSLTDEELNRQLVVTSGTSINIARILPQTVYYFWALAQLQRQGIDTGNVVVSVPCSNLGNLTSGLIAQAMGLPIKRFLSVENDNNIFYNYVKTGIFSPRPSKTSIAPALDSGNPTNFGRVQDLLGTLDNIRNHVHAYSYHDGQIIDTMRAVYRRENYLLDPHSAVAYQALLDDLQPGETGISLATAHSVKWKETVERIIGQELTIPSQLARFLAGNLQVKPMNSGFTSFKRYLMREAKG